jgi:hypothetical protein
MNDPKLEGATRTEGELAQYVRPQIAIMSDQEVLKAFQMTAVEISAAGCWWMVGGGSR